MPIYIPEIPFLDQLFSIGFALYLCLANCYRFDTNARQVAQRKQQGKSYPEKPEWFPLSNEPWLAKYMLTAVTLGLLFPLVAILLAPQPIAEATAPHLYV